MEEEDVIIQLFRELKRVGADQETAESVATALETEENYKKMLEVLKPMKHPSRVCLLAKALLIADPE